MGGQVRMRETRPEKFPRSGVIEDMSLYRGEGLAPCHTLGCGKGLSPVGMNLDAPLGR